MVATVVNRIGEHDICSRVTDKYVDATTLCKAAGKRWNDYFTQDDTKAFLSALADKTGLDCKILVQSTRGRTGGTWVHPLVAVNFGQWVSADFAVAVSMLVTELFAKGTVTIAQPAAAEMVQVPAAEWEKQQGQVEHLTRAVERLSGLLDREQPVVMIAPAIPQYTVMGRLKHRGYGKLTKWARQKIYRIARGKIEEVSEDPLCQAGGEGNGGPCFFTGPHVAILDDAIDKVLEMLKAKEREECKRQPSLEFEVRIRRTDAA